MEGGSDLRLWWISAGPCLRTVGGSFPGDVGARDRRCRTMGTGCQVGEEFHPELGDVVVSWLQYETSDTNRSDVQSALCIYNYSFLVIHLFIVLIIYMSVYLFSNKGNHVWMSKQNG